MSQWPAGVTRYTRHATGKDNTGVHQNAENAGVHQNTRVHLNANTNTPQNGHAEPSNNPTIKTENMIDATGDEDEVKMKMRN